MSHSIHWGNTFCGNHTELANIGIMENESEADVCSDKIFCEFHFCVIKTFFYHNQIYLLILSDFQIHNYGC